MESIEKRPYRILVAGSRDMVNYEQFIKSCIKKFFVKAMKVRDREDIVLVSGHARGADKLGEEVASELGIKIELHIPDWDNLGKKAGILRNIEMAESGVDYALIFWDGFSKGTKNMVQLLIKRNVPKKIYILRR